jgi:hypothetical protein
VSTRKHWQAMGGGEVSNLPNADKAVIDRAKFENYSMDPDNANNDGKWMAWNAIGFDVDTEAGRRAATDDVLAQLESQLAVAPATVGKTTGWGQRFEVGTIINGPSGQGTLRTVWQIEGGIPRLITNWLEVRS